MNVFATSAALMEHEAGVVCSVCDRRHRVADDNDCASGCWCCPSCEGMRQKVMLRDIGADFPDLYARCPTNRWGERQLTVPIFDEALARTKAKAAALEAKLRAEGELVDDPFWSG